MKKSVLIFLFLFIALDSVLLAQSGQSVATKISSFYTSFIRPILIAWVIIQLAVGGIMANNKIRKSEDESGDAMIGWFKMAIWPIVVLGAVEIGNALYN